MLQKKTSVAAKILSEIQKIDDNNPNLYLAKSIFNIYDFKPRQAEQNIIIAKKLNTNESLKNNIEKVNLISNLLNLRIRSFID